MQQEGKRPSKATANNISVRGEAQIWRRRRGEKWSWGGYRKHTLMPHERICFVQKLIVNHWRNLTRSSAQKWALEQILQYQCRQEGGDGQIQSQGSEWGTKVYTLRLMTGHQSFTDDVNERNRWGRGAVGPDRASPRELGSLSSLRITVGTWTWNPVLPGFRFPGEAMDRDSYKSSFSGWREIGNNLKHCISQAKYMQARGNLQAASLQPES